MTGGIAARRMTDATALQTEQSRRHRLLHLDLLLAVFVAGLLVSVLVQLDQQSQLILVNRDLDVALVGLIVGVSLTAAAIFWLDDREDALAWHALLGGALLVLAVGNATWLVALALGQDTLLGLSAETPRQVPAYSFLVVRGLAALLLALAALAELLRWKWLPRSAQVIVVVAIGAAALSLPLAALFEQQLPPLVQLELIPADATGPTFVERGTPTFAAASLAVAAVYGLSALLYRGAYARMRQRRTAFLALAGIVAMFAQVHWALNFTGYVGIVAGGDVLRVFFFVMVALALQAHARSVLRDLRLSRASILKLRDADVAKAALEERAHLAREIHDGLTQELWLAKLRAGELATSIKTAPDRVPQALDDLRTAIDEAIYESRHSIAALDAAAGPGGGFVAALRSYIEQMRDRFDLDVEVIVEDEANHMPERTSGQIMRIVQEALTNVRKHAGAARVRVLIRTADEGVRIVIEDDGVGFASDASVGRGVRSMIERAQAVGGQLTVEPRSPERGTRVLLYIPRE
jgi:signal transduction histidine kinase